MGFLSIGLKVLPLIVEAVNWVERFIKGKGVTKQDAAIKLVVSMLNIAESTTSLDITDSKVESAARKVIDAVVALQNIISEREKT
jgi:hypothetical protein